MFVFPSFLFLVSQYFNPVSLLNARIREFIGAHFFVRIGLLLAFGSFLSSSLMAAEPRIEAGALDPVKTVYKSEPFFDTEMIIRMIANLDARPNGKKLNIAVGSFNYENTDLQSSFSSVLAKEMEAGLAASGKVNLISRKRLAEDHAKDGGNPYKSLEPNSKIQKESMPGVNAILRGRFYRSGDGVLVEAELAQVGDGETKLAHLDISAEKVRERLSVGDAKSGAKSGLEPANIRKSLDNVKQIVTDRFDSIPRDFPVEIFTGDGKRAYVAGENISFRVRSAEDCHITVVSHQSDGRSVVLFPNRWSRDTLLHANQTIEIPGSAFPFKMRIGPPFGSDIVEVIACSRESEIHKKFAQNLPSASEEEHPFQVVTRGIIVEGIDTVIADQKSLSPNTSRWGQDHIIVSTFP